MAQFHEGQEVRIAGLWGAHLGGKWRDAKIIRQRTWTAPIHYEVEFSDGTRAVVDADHIRTVEQTLGASAPSARRPASQHGTSAA